MTKQILTRMFDEFIIALICIGIMIVSLFFIFAIFISIINFPVIMITTIGIAVISGCLITWYKRVEKQILKEQKDKIINSCETLSKQIYEEDKRK